MIFLWKIKGMFNTSICENSLPVDEYREKSDISRIMRYLRIKKSSFAVKMLLSFVCALLLLTIGIILDVKIDVVLNSGIFSNLYLYLIINILCVIILIMTEYKDILSGLNNIIKFRPNSDSIILLAGIGAMVQSITAFFLKNEILSGTFSLYTSVFGIAVLLDVIGKFYRESRIKRNFRFLISAKDKFSIKKLEGKKSIQEKFDILVSKKSVVAYQGRIKDFNNFIRLSYTSNSNDKVINKIAVMNILVLFFGTITDIIVERNFLSAIQTFTLLSCLCAPISNIFIVSKCMWRSCKKLIRSKVMLVGYDAVNKLKGITHVIFNSNQIYPPKCVVIKGIRAFGEQHIDNVLLYAAAVSNSLPSTLNGVFEKAYSSKKIVVPEASNVEYENYLGLIGWVNGKRVLVGNRELLKKYKVYPPSQVFEDKCCAKGQRAIYVAINRELAAMFIILYKPNREIVNDIKNLVRSGIKLLVGANDSCITEKTVSDDFCIPSNTLQVVRRLDEVDFEGNDDQSDMQSIITGDKNIKSFFKGLMSCMRLKYVISVISAIEMCACVVGLIMMVILIMYRGILQIGTVEFLIFTLFWQISMYGVSYIYGT